jgi:hypothetical protein
MTASNYSIVVDHLVFPLAARVTLSDMFALSTWSHIDPHTVLPALESFPLFFTSGDLSRATSYHWLVLRHKRLKRTLHRSNRI